MQSTQSRRRLLATLSSAAAASAFGGAISAQEAPPETKTIRLIQNAGICVAPQYVADELLRAEGFNEIQYVMRSPAIMAQARSPQYVRKRKQPDTNRQYPTRGHEIKLTHR